MYQNVYIVPNHISICYNIKHLKNTSLRVEGTRNIKRNKQSNCLRMFVSSQSPLILKLKHSQIESTPVSWH